MSVSPLALFTGKCPRCRKGPVFKPVLGRTILSMYPDCPNCGLHFERESGYFVGAMYVSYTIGVGLVLPLALALVLIAGWGYIPVTTIAIVETLVIMPLAFRWARVFWLHMDYAFFPR
jgi:uncharacterized protein (DUF983 family)